MQINNSNNYHSLFCDEDPRTLYESPQKSNVVSGTQLVQQQASDSPIEKTQIIPIRSPQKSPKNLQPLFYRSPATSPSKIEALKKIITSRPPLTEESFLANRTPTPFKHTVRKRKFWKIVDDKNNNNTSKPLSNISRELFPNTSPPLTEEEFENMFRIKERGEKDLVLEEYQKYGLEPKDLGLNEDEYTAEELELHLLYELDEISDEEFDFEMDFAGPENQILESNPWFSPSKLEDLEEKKTDQ